MNLRLTDIFDVEILREMLDSLWQANGIPLGLIDAEGQVIIAVGWQKVCTDYHLRHPDLAPRCILNHPRGFAEGEGPVEAVCSSGLIDIVLPIRCGREYLGLLLAGQFLDRPADRGHCLAFAAQCGFDEEAYLAMLAEVPVIPREKIGQFTAFYAALARLLSESSLRKLREEQVHQDLAASRQALEESEARFRGIVEGTPLGIHMYQCDAAGRLLFAGSNPAADIILGLDNRKFLGKELLEAFPALAGTEVPDGYRQVCATGRPWQTEHVNYADGKISGAFQVHAFRTGPGRVASVFMDISERLRAERLKDDFISTAAHELRTPITSILGYTELMLDRLPQLTPEQLREYLCVIHHRSEALAQIVEDMLDLSRMQSGQGIPLARQPDDFGRLLHEVVGHYRQVNDGHDLRLQIAGPLPLLEFDGAKLHQVFDNLLSNAFKFSPRGSEIIIAVAEQGEGVLTEVADRGIGMTPEQVARVFDKFYRADASSTASASGLGLGMSLVKGIIEGHGGRIWVTSTPGSGTTVSFVLPAGTRAGGVAG